MVGLGFGLGSGVRVGVVVAGVSNGGFLKKVEPPHSG